MNTFFRYVGVGALSFVVNIAITVSLHEAFGVDERAAFAVALAVVFTMNFLLARHYIFPAAGGAVGTQLTRFTIAALLFRLLEWAGFYVVTTWLSVSYLVAAPGVLAASTLGKYFFYRVVVFPRSEAGP